eukprot:UN15287
MARGSLLIFLISVSYDLEVFTDAKSYVLSGPYKYFCGGIRKKFHLKNEVFSEYSILILMLIVSKFLIFFLFTFTGI